VRISPIRAGMEARFLHHHGKRLPVAFRDHLVPRPVKRVRCERHEHGRTCFRPGLPREVFPKASVEEILLAQAEAGLLARMQSFDWQIVHGIRVSSGDGLGAFLDVTI
jgi:hypothetical protein